LEIQSLGAFTCHRLYRDIDKTSDVTLAVSLADSRRFRVGRRKCTATGFRILVWYIWQLRKHFSSRATVCLGYYFEI